MLSYQRNSLLSLLAQFKMRLYDYNQETPRPIQEMAIIDRNLTSIEKQIKKL
jgi:hypothetical protein